MCRSILSFSHELVRLYLTWVWQFFWRGHLLVMANLKIKFPGCQPRSEICRCLCSILSVMILSASELMLNTKQRIKSSVMFTPGGIGHSSGSTLVHGMLEPSTAGILLSVSIMTWNHQTHTKELANLIISEIITCILTASSKSPSLIRFLIFRTCKTWEENY